MLKLTSTRGLYRGVGLWSFMPLKKGSTVHKYHHYSIRRVIKLLSALVSGVGERGAGPCTRSFGPSSSTTTPQAWPATPSSSATATSPRSARSCPASRCSCSSPHSSRSTCNRATPSEGRGGGGRVHRQPPKFSQLLKCKTS